MTRARSEGAAWFDAAEAGEGANFAAEVDPGYPGMVVAKGLVGATVWGLPLVMAGKEGKTLNPAGGLAGFSCVGERFIKAMAT